jgi:hypothetical protein
MAANRDDRTPNQFGRQRRQPTDLMGGTRPHKLALVPDARDQPFVS